MHTHAHTTHAHTSPRHEVYGCSFMCDMTRACVIQTDGERLCKGARHPVSGRAFRGTATHCNAQQHIATHCNTLQHTATQVAKDFAKVQDIRFQDVCFVTVQHTATHCNTLQHRRRKTLQRCKTSGIRTCGSWQKVAYGPRVLLPACSRSCLNPKLSTLNPKIWKVEGKPWLTAYVPRGYGVATISRLLKIIRLFCRM